MSLQDWKITEVKEGVLRVEHPQAAIPLILTIYEESVYLRNLYRLLLDVKESNEKVY